MPIVHARDGESVDSLIRRYKRNLEKSGIPREARRRQYREKDSDKRKRDKAAAIKRHQKKLQREAFGHSGQRRKDRRFVSRATVSSRPKQLLSSQVLA